MFSDDDHQPDFFNSPPGQGPVLGFDVGGCGVHCAGDRHQACGFFFSKAMPFFVVAEGLGDKSVAKWAGYFAAQKVATLLQLARHQGEWFWHENWGPPPVAKGSHPMHAILLFALARAHDQLNRIRDHAQQSARLEATVTVGLIHQQQLFFAHVGDTRLYLLRTFQLRCLTRDHTQAMVELERGAIAFDQYDHHPQRRVLTQWLGGSVRHEVMLGCVDVRAGDSLLFCTPQCYSALNEEMIRNTLAVDVLRASQKAVELCALAEEKGRGTGAAAIVACLR